MEGAEMNKKGCRGWQGMGIDEKKYKDGKEWEGMGY